MSNAVLSKSSIVRVGAVVRAESSVAEIQAVNGNLVGTDRLGPGVVSEISPSGEVRVHWVAANLDAWVRQADLLQFEDNARLLTVQSFDWLGRCKATRYHVIKGIGLRFNWVVEVRRKNILRATRPDGNTWTFEWYPIFREAHPLHTLLTEGTQLDDDQAEALTVAEIVARGR